MPTLVTITVKPSGGDYTSLNTALSAVNSNLITSDEQVTIECDTFSGGLAEQVTVPAITQDATRYLEIKAAAGHEYNPVDDSGFYLTASVGFSAVLVNSQSFTRILNIGAKNTRTLGNARGIDCFGSNNIIRGCYATSAGSSGSVVYFLNNAANLDISECLSYLGSTGFDFGNNFARTANKLTSVDASSVGIDTGTADTTLTNSFSIGSSDPYLGTFNASSSNNAGDSTDTPGTTPFNNRTTADLANYALGDFRTASGSALATGGSVDFIGYALESGATGTTASVTESLSLFSDSSAIQVDYNVSISVTETLGSYADSSTVSVVPDVNVTASVTESLNSYSDSVSVTITAAGEVSATVTEQLGSYSDSVIADISANVNTNVTEVLNSFLDSSNVTIAKDITLTITESLQAYNDSISVKLPANWVNKQPASTDWSDKAQTSTIWTKKG